MMLGLNAKKNYNKKRSSATKATVVDVKVEEERTDDGFYKSCSYILTLSYLHNGSYVSYNYKSLYEYEVGSVIDVDVYNGIVYSILTEPAKDIMDKVIDFNLKGHKVLIYLGMFLLGFAIFGFIVSLIDYMGPQFIFLECLIFELIMLYVYRLLIKLKEKMERKYNLIISGGYSCLTGKVVDKKKEVRRTKNGYTDIYYPIVLYNDGFSSKKRVLSVSKDYDIGEDVIIYKDRITKDILSREELEFLNLKIKLLGIISVIILIVAFLGGMSYV